MTRISSHSTLLTKWGVPPLCLVIAALAVLTDSDWREHLGPAAIVLSMTAFVSVAVVRKRLGPLVDSVDDAGEHLIAKRNTVTEKVPFSRIVGVELDRSSVEPRIVLKLAAPGAFGTEIVFRPKDSSDGAKVDRLAADLRDKAASRSA